MGWKVCFGESGGDGGEGFGLGLVEGVLVGVLFAVGGEAAEVEVFGGIFDGDEVALDEGGEGGVGDVELAEVGDGHAASGCGEFGEDGGLVVVELGDAGRRGSGRRCVGCVGRRALRLRLRG